MALALSSAVVALTLVACGARAAGDAVEPSGVLTLGEARAFDEHPLVYAGDQVDGLPLEAILRRDDTARYVSFVYGECRPPSRESGCAPPAEIQVWPVASRSLDSYRSPAPVTPVPLPMPTTIRGLPAAFFDHGTRLEIYAPRTTIVLFSHSRDRVLTIAAALRCLARAPPSDHGNRTLDC